MWLILVRFAAMVVGLGFAHFLEAPAKMAYPALLYIELPQSLYVQWGPPLAFFLRRQKAPCWFLASSLALPLGFFGLVAPANAAFRAAPASTSPSDFAELQNNWEFGHALAFWAPVWSVRIVDPISLCRVAQNRHAVTPEFTGGIRIRRITRSAEPSPGGAKGRVTR
jgi:hypothetical protein